MLPKRKKSKYNKNTKIIADHGRVRNELLYPSKKIAIPLVEMDTNHIKNAIQKIKRGDSNHNVDGNVYRLLVMEKIYREIYSIDKINKNGKK